MRVGPPRRAMLLISCALLATRRPPLWLDAKAADSPRSPKPPIPCAYRHPATRRRAAANHAGSSLSRGCILRSHPLRMPSRNHQAMVGADLSVPTKTCRLRTAYRAAILCQVELETSEVWT